MERIAFGVLISIDTDNGLGATSVYGLTEIMAIIEAGAKARGQEAITAPVDSPEIEKEKYTLNVTIVNKGEKT